MAKKVEKNGLNIREWVRERILFLAVGIFVVGGTGYIAAGKVLDSQNIWLHPGREFALLISLSFLDIDLSKLFFFILSNYFNTFIDLLSKFF